MFSASVSLKVGVWDPVQDGLRSIHHNICWSTSILENSFFGLWIWRLACTLSCSMRKINIMFVRSILQRPTASRLPIEYRGCKKAVKKQQETHTNFLSKFNEKVSEVTLFTVLYYHLWPTQPRFPHISCKISPKAHLSSHSPRIMLRKWCTKPKVIQAPCTRTRSYLFHPNELDLIPWRA